MKEREELGRWISDYNGGKGGGVQAELKLTTGYSALVGIRSFKNAQGVYKVTNEAGFLI